MIVGWRVADGVALAGVHDRATPVRPSDLRVTWEIDGEAHALTHADGDLWRAAVPLPDGLPVDLCAEDRAGNRACASVQTAETPRDGCACHGAGTGTGPLAWLAAIALRRRRTAGRSARRRASSDGAGRETP